MNPIVAVWLWLRGMWMTGAFWAQMVVLTFLWWFLILFISALAPIPYLPLLLTILPIVAFVTMVVAYVDVMAVIAAVPQTRHLARRISSVLGTQLLIGLYFVFVPIHNDRVLALVLVVVLFALLFFVLGTQGRLTRAVVSALVITVFVITGIFFAGGRQQIRQYAQPTPAAAAQPPCVWEDDVAAGKQVTTVRIGQLTNGLRTRHAFDATGMFTYLWRDAQPEDVPDSARNADGTVYDVIRGKRLGPGVTVPLDIRARENLHLCVRELQPVR